MTTTNTHTPAGTTVKSVDAGMVRVDIVKAVGGYTVRVTAGSQPVDGWVHPYTTRSATKDAFDHAVTVFTAHGSESGIARHRHNLIAERDRLSRLRSVTSRIGQIDAELDGLQDLTTRAQLTAFVADQHARHAA